jgi:hypothetical protein
MRVFAILLWMLVAVPGWAQQVGFSSKYIGTEAEFAYVWQARDGRTESMIFRLPMEDLQRGAVEFTAFERDELVKDMQAALKDEAAKLSNGMVQVSMGRLVGSGMQMRIEGPRDQLTPQLRDTLKAQLELVQLQVEDQFLQRHWYRRKDGDEHVYMPDHVRLVKRYSPALAPVVQAVRAQTAGRSQREVIDFVMGWLQSIPYDTLTSRYATTGSGGGAGYQTPYGLILNNKGDCDTKAVALLAIVHALYPELPLAMVYVPGHAFAGIGVPQGPHDYALGLGDAVVVLADPTGPGLFRLGEVEPESKAVLAKGGGWHLRI